MVRMISFKVFRDFQEDKRGAVAIIFGASVFALALAIGSAIDFGRAHATKTRLQNALDAAVLAAAKKMMQSDDDFDANTAVKTFFKVDQPTNHLSSIVKIEGTPVNSETVRGVAIAEVPTTFMQIAGFKKLEIYTDSEASFGLGSAEIALVLDTTGSMGGSKLDTLKSAAKELVTTVSSLGQASKRVKIGLVPFAQYVNVGTGNRSASWLYVPDDYTETKNVCYKTRPIVSKTNCRTETRTGYNDGVPYTYDAEVCDIEYGPEEETCTDQTYAYTWRGCVGSRDYPLSVQDGSYGTRVPGLLNYHCPSELIPLTTEQDEVKSGIDAMVASGETYIPSGLAWGWRVLSNAVPYTQGKKQDGSSNDVRKFIVLMTDGSNTRSVNYVSANVNDHWGSDTADANKVTAELCTNIKADKIEIFTIAFEVTDTTIKDILKSCASAGGAFYDAANSSQLSAAFKDIASSLGQLRLSK